MKKQEAKDKRCSFRFDQGGTSPFCNADLCMSWYEESHGQGHCRRDDVEVRLQQMNSQLVEISTQLKELGEVVANGFVGLIAK